MLDVPPRWSLVIGALAAIPIAVYGIDRGDPVAALTGVSLLVILASLFVAFTPPRHPEPTPG